MLAQIVLPLTWIILSRTARAGVAILDTPGSLVTCEPTMLHWDDGVSPYYLSVLPGGEPNAPALKTFTQTDGNTLTWLVDLDPGTSVSIALKDSTGAITYAAAVTIMPGKSSSCVDSSTSVAQQIADPATPSSPSETASSESPTSSASDDTASSTASAEANEIASEVVAKDISPTSSATESELDAPASSPIASTTSVGPSASASVLISRIVSSVSNSAATHSHSAALPTGTAQVGALTGGARGQTQKGMTWVAGAMGVVAGVAVMGL